MQTPLDNREVVVSTFSDIHLAYIWGGEPDVVHVQEREAYKIENQSHEYGPAVVIHELLHRNDRMTCWTEYAEEGVVDALTADLVPIYSSKYWHVKLRHELFYPRAVRFVRQRSARATGTPWRSYTARKWRADLWRADCATRIAALS